MRKNMKDKKENTWRNEEKAFSGSDEATFQNDIETNIVKRREERERSKKTGNKTIRFNEKMLSSSNVFGVFFSPLFSFLATIKKNKKIQQNMMKMPKNDQIPTAHCRFNARLFHLRSFHFWSFPLRFQTKIYNLPYIGVFVPHFESILHFYCCLLCIWIIAWPKTRNIQPQLTCIAVIISRSTEKEFRRKRKKCCELKTKLWTIYICHVYGQICVWTTNTSKNDRRRRRRCLAVISTYKNSIQCSSEKLMGSNKPKNQSLDGFNMTWSIINHVHLRTILENWCCW